MHNVRSSIKDLVIVHIHYFHFSPVWQFTVEQETFKGHFRYVYM